MLSRGFSTKPTLLFRIGNSGPLSASSVGRALPGGDAPSSSSSSSPPADLKLNSSSSTSDGGISVCSARLQRQRQVSPVTKCQPLMSCRCEPCYPLLSRSAKEDRDQHSGITPPYLSLLPTKRTIVKTVWSSSIFAARSCLALSGRAVTFM